MYLLLSQLRLSWKTTWRKSRKEQGRGRSQRWKETCVHPGCLWPWWVESNKKGRTQIHRGKVHATGPISHFTPKRQVRSAACVCPELQEASVSRCPALESISHSPSVTGHAAEGILNLGWVLTSRGAAHTLRENSEVANLSVLSFFPSQNWISNHLFATSAARRLLRMTPSSNLHYHSSQTNDILVSCPCPITSWKITASHAPRPCYSSVQNPVWTTSTLGADWARLGCTWTWDSALSSPSLSLLQTPVCVLFFPSQVLFLLLTFELLSNLHLIKPSWCLLWPPDKSCNSPKKFPRLYSF